ncbi:DUF6261 family protein [Parabacteroides sp. PH5-39]|nr:DUF6261 family protein [Parabacteroides sp. PH5-39]
MKTIQTFSVTHLLLASHYEFHRTTERLMAQAGEATLHIENLLTPYRAAIEQEFKIINQNKRLTNTQLLKELDKKRGELLSRLIRLIEAAKYSSLETEREAYTVLIDIIAPYRYVSRNEYTKETAQLRGLIRDMGTAAAVRNLDILKIAPAVQQLREANSEFASAMTDRVNTEAVRPQNQIDISTTDQRKIIDDMYREIIERINAYSIAVPSEDIDDFIKVMNAQIDQYKRVISHLRPGGSGNEEVNPEEDTPEEEQEQEQENIEEHEENNDN